jgi:hypothetical protein
LVLKPPSRASKPSIVLHGARAIGICDGLSLDAVMSCGAGSRKVESYFWSIERDGSSKLPIKMQRVTEATNAPAADCVLNPRHECARISGRARFEILQPDIPPGVYTVTCTATSFMGVSASASVQVEKNATHSIPQIRILGANPFIVYRAQGLELHAAIDTPKSCPEHLYTQLTQVSGEEDVKIIWALVGGNDRYMEHGLEEEEDNAFVLGIANTRGSTLQLSPEVMRSARLDHNYTVLLSVEVFESGTGTLIINKRVDVTLQILPSKPVIRVVFGGKPYIHRGFHATNRFPGQEIEPAVIDASFSYDPDGGGLCYSI